MPRPRTRATPAARVKAGHSRELRVLVRQHVAAWNAYLVLTGGELSILRAAFAALERELRRATTR